MGISMRYTDCFNYTALDIPAMVWNKLNRYARNYGGDCRIGKLDTLGWFIFSIEADRDVLLWSEVLS